MDSFDEHVFKMKTLHNIHQQRLLESANANEQLARLVQGLTVSTNKLVEVMSGVQAEIGALREDLKAIAAAKRTADSAVRNLRPLPREYTIRRDNEGRMTGMISG